MSAQAAGFDYGIEAIGAYVPRSRIHCADRAERLSVPRDTLVSRIGFDTLSVKDSGETTSDLACRAIADLLERCRIDPQRIGCLVVVTQNPDGYGIPPVSAIVHGRMGWPTRVASFDLALGCSGYVYALSLTAGFLQSLGADYGVLVTADPYSKIVDPDDRATALLFGDAATATLLSRQAPWRIGAADFGTSGDHAGSLMLDERRRLRMVGKDVARFCIREVPGSIARALEKNAAALDEVDVVLLHQGSKFIVESIGDALGVPEKTPFLAQDVGNTCCSSIPLVLAPLLSAPSGARTLVLSSFGVGLSWGSTVLRYAPQAAAPAQAQCAPQEQAQTQPQVLAVTA
ncbi:3-oxoacyl-ACP synthase III family protein [Lysobacter enzymogenes]|uniref:3-oxoacyl-ACP synthase III family protein n=1 Tax=Lysobacter enzymogenes TaxID=69 RepID=UPI001A9784E9|nr:ketoacyl-ACP synthase III [Lysobacter enzymogenes]QQP94984.1 ketoacyl-ACP synthase III [Lysobacter enzymogenes]